MLPINYIFEVNVFLFSYLFVYNVSMLLFFWFLFSNLVLTFKTLNNFNYLYFTFYCKFSLTVILLSLAGVPPFIGFFSKLFLLILIFNNSFMLLYNLMLILLLCSLYFYVQNIRFIHSTYPLSMQSQSLFSERKLSTYFYVSNIVIWFIIFGLFYIDDILLLCVWILS